MNYDQSIIANKYRFNDGEDLLSAFRFLRNRGWDGWNRAKVKGR